MRNLSHAERCFQDIPGTFHGPHVYTAAVSMFSQQDLAKGRALFLELGAYMGQSTCFMARLIKRRRAPIELHVIDIWAPLLENDAGASTSFAWIPSNHRASALAAGKGEMSMAWAHNMITSGSWDAISRVVHGSDTDMNIVSRYSDDSVSFIYLDTSHGYWQTKRELQLWWPKLKASGSLLCGDDYDAAKRDTPRSYAAALHAFFEEHGARLFDWGGNQFCVAKGDIDARPTGSHAPRLRAQQRR